MKTTHYVVGEHGEKGNFRFHTLCGQVFHVSESGREDGCRNWTIVTCVDCLSHRPRVATDELLDRVRQMAATLGVTHPAWMNLSLSFNELDQRMLRGDVPAQWRTNAAEPARGEKS